MTGPAAASRWAPSPRQPLFTPAAVNRPRCRLAGPPLWRLDGALARNARRRRDPGQPAGRGHADAARGQISHISSYLPSLASPHCQLPPRRLFSTAASPPSSQALRAVDGWEVDHLPGCSLPGTAFAVRSPCAQTNSSAELVAAAALADVVVLGRRARTEGGSESSAPSHVHAVGRLPAWARTRTRRSQAALDDLSHVCRGRRLFTAAQL